jgi:DNA invertase Pin-like site-specific DNA recombinase
MSTDMQECSIVNQAVAIQRYADANGFVVVKTYEDAGRSGLTITQRKGLQLLLSDVVLRRATFHAILVYDVSRWGRFQDSDEAAHYEFLCKSSGVKIHYCAEEFGPDETLPARMMKALKRTMAAEFSRELSERISAAKRNRALMGFHQAGLPGYALRRALVGSDGTLKQVLRSGERKSISSDHIILVPGTKREQKWVRWIYEQRISGFDICDIVKEFNLRKVLWIDGKPWNTYSVRQILTNRKYAGWNCWAQRSEKLKTKSRRNPPDQWVMVEGAFKGIVDQTTFDRAQRVIRHRLNYKSNETVLRDLKALWKRRGTLSEAIIDHARGVPAVSGLRHRFGSMVKLYELLGFKPDPLHAINTAKAQTMLRLRAQVFASVRESFPYDVTFTRPSGVHGYRFAFADTGNVAVILCRSIHRPKGLRCWTMYLRATTRNVPALVCLLSRDNQSIEAYYVMPKIDAIAKMTLTPRDPWFEGGIRLESMNKLHSALTEVKKWVPLGVVHRGISNAYTLLMGPPSRTRIHDEERREAGIARSLKPQPWLDKKA